MNMTSKVALLVLASLLATMGGNSTLADDTEVYLNTLTLPPEQTRPNVLFILDTSGSMGLPLDTKTYGTRSNKEVGYYDPSVTYPGEKNFAGGAGDSNYYYLYARPSSYANQFIYYNKVEKSQMTCDMSALDATNKYLAQYYVYDSAGNWTTGGKGGTDMCAAHDASCGFTSGSSGPLVDCSNEKNYGGFTYTNGKYLWAVSANFHNFLQSYYRYSTLLTVMKDLIDKNNDINMSMMRFHSGSGGYIFSPSLVATNSGNQQTMRDALDDIFLFGDSTPLAETLWEAKRFLYGESADFGNDSGTNTPSGAYSSGTTYNSPIDYACQKTRIVILTDGAPSADTSRDSEIANLIGHSCSGDCLDDLAEWIHKDPSNTPSELRDSSSTLPDDQVISIDTIGLGADTDPTLLQNTANNGGGKYYTAKDAASLADAFARAVGAATYDPDTSVAPAVAINTYSGLEHRDDLFFALYQPESSPRWTGNIKKYKLIGGEILDATGTPAIDSTTGFFKDTAKSYWTVPRDLDGDGVTDFTVDGNVIARGGVATNLIGPTTRQFYTYTGPAPVNTGVTAPTPISLNNENLDLNSSNSIPDNTIIKATPTLLGASVTTSAYAQEIIDWARGGTANATNVGTPNPTPPNYYFPDVIHNPPVVVTYKTDEACLAGNPTDTSSCFDDTLFVGTNLGTFHAFNLNTYGLTNPSSAVATEDFAFIPKELLTNLTTYYEEKGGFTAKIYGLDGAMLVWRYDADDDGNIDAAKGDHVYIYQPMRRGGTDLYAFDMTTRTDPKLMWQIVGTGLDAIPAGAYSDLAQTWSKPQHVKISWCGGTCTKDVLIFGGGYDPVHDTATSPVTNSKGNAIYMVDATTGELLWAAGDGAQYNYNNSKLTNSFAADISVIDINGDGTADAMFAIDVQGNLWRFDFNNKASSASDFVGTQAGMIAQLGGTGTDFRRFYNAPDIAYFAPRGKDPFFTISVASGYRAHPRDKTIDDYLFVLFDPNALSAPSDYGYANGSSIQPSDLTLAKLLPTSPNPIGKYGWRLKLEGLGEKGLSPTVTFAGNILMTSYIPDSSSTSCKGSTGTGVYYYVNALTGISALIDTKGTSTTADDTREAYSTLENSGIPPGPSVIFGRIKKCVSNCSPTGGPTTGSTNEERRTASITVGTEIVDTTEVSSVLKSYWRKN